ncbi:hypothetical protein AB0327_004727 [Salmonella enterica]
MARLSQNRCHSVLTGCGQYSSSLAVLALSGCAEGFSVTGTDCINTNGGVDAFIPAPYTDGSIISASAETPPPTSLFPQACNQRTIVVKLLLHVSDLCPKFCSMCFN